jgi:hypothetical protein
MMTVLALDPGNTVGWCRSDGRNGVVALAAYADKGEALSVFQNWLSDQFAVQPTMMLLVERPFFHRPSLLADFTNALIWTAHATAFRFDVPRHERSADDVRRYLLGRARRKKMETEPEFDRAILAAVQARGFFPTSEHSADAAALLLACEDRQPRIAA